MSSWIKLVDQSFSKVVTSKNHRNKRPFRSISPANIEDDSSQESCNPKSTLPVKKQKLETLSIERATNSSDECTDVEYNPDAIELPNITNRKPMPTLPIITCVSSAVHTQPSTSRGTNTTGLFSWTNMQRTKTDTIQIEDSLSDSDAKTLIDESSDSSPSSASNRNETVIETQDSITPPVAPFVPDANKEPKKRKVRMIKGGMVEQLKKTLSHAKSNVLFWQHHRSVDLVPSGTIVTVNRVEHTYGRILIHSKVGGADTIFSLCSKLTDVREGDVIEVDFDSEHKHMTDTHVFYPYVDKVLFLNKKS